MWKKQAFFLNSGFFYFRSPFRTLIETFSFGPNRCHYPEWPKYLISQNNWFSCKCFFAANGFAASGRWKWSFLLQMVAASGFAANVLFCCKWPAISDRAASGKKVATNGLAASRFAAIGLYAGSVWMGRCEWICYKCPYTSKGHLLLA